MNQTIIRKQAQDEVNRVASEHGLRIDPAMLVDMASDTSNPMHEYFEWDNDKAGHKHRIDQARTLIRSITVVIVSKNVEVTAVAYVRDPSCETGESGYIAVSKVRTEEDNAREVMLAEFGRVAGALKRARELATVFDMTEDVNEYIAGIDLMKIKVSETRQ